MGSHARFEVETDQRALANMTIAQHDSTTWRWRAIASVACAQPLWMSPLRCLEGLSCRWSPAVFHAARSVCNDFHLVARRVQISGRHLPPAAEVSRFAVLVHRKICDKCNDPVEETIKHLDCLGCQFDEDSAPIGRIPAERDQLPLGHAMDDPLRITLGCTGRGRQSGERSRLTAPVGIEFEKHLECRHGEELLAKFIGAQALHTFGQANHDASICHRGDARPL